MRYYAHRPEDGTADRASWEPLEVHLEEVAELAASFAEAFDSGEWGRIAGLWHDLGKYRDAFQRRLAGEPISAEHAIVGACHALACDPHMGTPLAFAIAGHHGGLPNRVEAIDGGRKPLKERIRPGQALLREVASAAGAELLEQPLPELPPFIQPRTGDSKNDVARRMAFWTRMLFSALVDADYLATEGYMQPRRAAQRKKPPTAGALAPVLDAHSDRLAAEAAGNPGAVNAARASILAQCRAAAEKPPGLFSLTVPTGGGKTLSGMSFALRHAALHGLERVIAVLPFTSIIEQNAAVYRKALGTEHVPPRCTGTASRIMSFAPFSGTWIEMVDWPCRVWGSVRMPRARVNRSRGIFSLQVHGMASVDWLGK